MTERTRPSGRVRQLAAMNANNYKWTGIGKCYKIGIEFNFEE